MLCGPIQVKAGNNVKVSYKNHKHALYGTNQGLVLFLKALEYHSMMCISQEHYLLLTYFLKA